MVMKSNLTLRYNCSNRKETVRLTTLGKNISPAGLSENKHFFEVGLTLFFFTETL